jgi:hypothetical protein
VNFSIICIGFPYGVMRPGGCSPRSLLIDGQIRQE